MGLEAATYIASLNSSNPVGSTDAKSQGDDHLRLLKSTIKNSFPGVDKATYLHQARADVASASITVDLPAATSDFLRITGTTAITGLGTMGAGTKKDVMFSGALTLTHDSGALILPGAANITTVANDRATFISLGSGNWICTEYTRASGKAVIPPAMSEVSSLFNTLLSGFVGVVFEWPGTLADMPSGFLPLDGRAISRTTYSALFTLWSTTYGVGDGTTTFNIPDDRGYVIAGMDNMGTAAGAANVVTATEADTLGGVYGEELESYTQQGTFQTGNNNATISLNGGASQAAHPTHSHSVTISGETAEGNNLQPTQFRHKMVWTGVV